MHDLKSIRDEPSAFDQGLKRRGLAPLSADILQRDGELRSLQTRLQQAQARRNEASKLIGQAKAKKDEAQAQALMAEVSGLKQEIQDGVEKERALQVALQDVLATIPNIPAADVPEGRDETSNIEIRRVGKAPAQSFAPKEHFDLGEQLGLMDFETASRMSGSRFVVLKGQLARLERAIASFMLDLHTGMFGYQEISPPILVREQAMFGTGQLPKFRSEQFYATKRIEWKNLEEVMDLDLNYRWVIENMRPEDLLAACRSVAGITEEQEQGYRDGDEEGGSLILKRFFEETKSVSEGNVHWLIPTSEVPLTNLVREQILEEAQLPIRVTAHTPCFRAEAGAAGKDTRGMIRMHQFSKVELVSITTPEQSRDEHERMTAAAEEVLKRLGLHFRTIVLCAGDMGFSATKTYDIEVWLPGQNAFREISSCSHCGDFQARRMNARYRPADGRPRFVHTLNGSGLAVGRTLVAILENYQDSNGRIAIPDALQPYMGGATHIES